MGAQADLALLSHQRLWPLPGDIGSAPNLLRSLPSDWSARASRPHRTADSRFSSSIRLEHPDSLVSDPRRYRTAVARTFYFSRPCSCRRYLLVSLRSSGVDEACHQTAGTAMGAALCRIIPISPACWSASLPNA